MDVFYPLKQVETPLRILYSRGFRKRRRREGTVREELRAQHYDIISKRNRKVSYP